MGPKAMGARRPRAVRAVFATFFACAACVAASQAAEPIKIGIISEDSAIAGNGISKAAQMAADDVNAHGGVDGRKIELVLYDDHASAPDAVRAFQRLVTEDKVVAVVGTFMSEVALALEPWAARLHVPFITTGATSNEISKAVHNDYAQMKYTFDGWVISTDQANLICSAIKVTLQSKYVVKSAVIFSEDAAWTTPLDQGYLDCLPKIGVTVLDHVRFAKDTNDFTPIYNKIEALKPDIIVTGISHVGVQPTVQWAQQQVPIPMVGVSSQGTNGTFWKDTNGATAGFIVFPMMSAEGAHPSTFTEPFVADFTKRFGAPPPYSAFSTYDAIHYMAEAVKLADSTDGDKLVEALERTDYVGVIGHIQFLGKDDAATHAIKTSDGFSGFVMGQWQDGKQVALRPLSPEGTDIKFPDFIHLRPAITTSSRP